MDLIEKLNVDLHCVYHNQPSADAPFGKTSVPNTIVYMYYP